MKFFSLSSGDFCPISNDCRPAFKTYLAYISDIQFLFSLTTFVASSSKKTTPKGGLKEVDMDCNWAEVGLALVISTKRIMEAMVVLIVRG